MKNNYQKLLEEKLSELDGRDFRPKLLLHVCCAPCSSYVLEYISRYFDITAFYYNPNIYPETEYHKRVEELKRFVGEAPFAAGVKVSEGNFDRNEFLEAVKGFENEPEGGMRCYRCYELRLRESAKTARDNGFDLFTTTLSISPMKNAQWLNEIGGRLAEEYGVGYLFSDFKKKDGYKRSIELSREYSLYRQDYCGCEFSYSQSLLRRK